jgi:thioredoxin reductase
VAELSARPFPPGDYPVVIVGSGPGGLQASYALSRLGVEHAVISRDDAPGGMFRRFPLYQRLVSWTKVDAPSEPGTREYEWYDHNSLIGDRPEHQGAVVPFVDRSYIVPSRPEMEQGLAAFAEKAGLRVRYGCAWESTRRDGDGTLALGTSDGEYRCRAAVFAIGVTEPWKSPISGIEHVPHYADAGQPGHYQGKRVFVIGKRNSGFELAHGVLPLARQVFLGSPRPVDTAVIALSSVRVRNLQPHEDAGFGGGTFVLDVAIERIERAQDGYRVTGVGTTRQGRLDLTVDEMIAATGFATPLLDLPALGVRTVAQGRIPALTPYWESDPGSGIYFAGNTTQGAPGLRKHGIVSSSASVLGFRYNARIMAEHLAETHLGLDVPRRRVEPGELVSYLLREATSAPELWAQKSYLARAVSTKGETRIVPLAHWLDDPRGRLLAIAIEMNAEGEISPAVYLDRNGDVEARLLPPHHLNDFEGEDYRRELEAVLAPKRLLDTTAPPRDPRSRCRSRTGGS